MRIVVDENISAAIATYGPLGELQTLPGREINATVCADADVLIVRSVTRIDAALLAASPVRFVGSTTAGTDHVDIDWLRSHGIRFAHAPGSNAESVVDYVMSALALAFPDADSLAARSVGIVGCGNVGSRLLARLRALGISCRVCDPLLPEGSLAERLPFEALLGCDVLSLHVPLSVDGDYATRHMVAAAELARMREDSLLINTSRGAVVDNRALREALSRRSAMRAVLDVWEGEPVVDPALMRRCLVATPHIAGYAIDGKLRGAIEVYEALRGFLGQGAPAAEITGLALPPGGVLDIPIEPRASLWQRSVRHCYDVAQDDAALRRHADGAQELARHFDRLRRDYPPRRELRSWRIAPALASCAEPRAAGVGA